MSEQEIYEGLMSWYRQSVVGLPESDALLPLMKATYTPEEASLVTGIPFQGKSLEELAEQKKMDSAELKDRMDALANKGLVFRVVVGDTIRYSLNDVYFVQYRATYWPGKTDGRTKGIAPWTNQYYYRGAWDRFEHTSTKYCRALPIEGTIEDTRGVMPYEEVAKVLDQHDYFSVSICPCRHRKKLDPDFEDSTYPMENCLHFGALGRYIDENGMGRQITREETEEILRKSAEAGLVHGVANWQEAPDTICNCDPNDCLFFEAFHKLKHVDGLSRSNYLVRVNQDTCIGCGLCVKRCPMYALKVEDAPETKDRITVVEREEGKKELTNKKGRLASVNLEDCIGCGVCVVKCPSDSLVLERKEVLDHPPKNPIELIQRGFAEAAAAKEQTSGGT